MNVLNLDDSAYNFIRRLVMYVLPALATFVIALGNIWHIPHTDEVSATIVAVNAFLGALVGLSRYQYNKNPKFDGEIVDIGDDLESVLTLTLDEGIDSLAKKDKVVLKPPAPKGH